MFMTIVIWIAIVVGCFVVSKKIQQKSQVVSKDFNFDNQKSNAKEFLKELLNDEYSFLKTDMKDNTIDAMTKGKIVISTEQKIKNSAIDLVKTILTLGKVKFSRYEPECYCILSGSNFHFFIYNEDDELDQHLIFDEEKIRSAQYEKPSVNFLEKYFNQSSAKEQIINFDGYKLACLDSIFRVGKIGNAFSEEYHQSLMKKVVVAYHFKEQLEKKPVGVQLEKKPIGA